MHILYAILCLLNKISCYKSCLLILDRFMERWQNGGEGFMAFLIRQMGSSDLFETHFVKTLLRYNFW